MYLYQKDVRQWPPTQEGAGVLTLMLLWCSWLKQYQLCTAAQCLDLLLTSTIWYAPQDIPALPGQVS